MYLCKKASFIRSFNQLTKNKLCLLNTIVCSSAFLGGGGSLSVFPLLIISAQSTAMSSQIFNQFIEKDLDSRMIRTNKRPLVTGQISTKTALILGSSLGIIGLCSSYMINIPTAIIAFSIWASYLFIYTPMKRYSQWNTVIGSLIGSAPIYMGWLASGAHPCMCEPISYFLYMTAWQLQHFYGIRWKYTQDYNRCFKMQQNKSNALFITTIIMILALISCNYSYTYCDGLPYVMDIILFSSSIIYYGFMSMYRFEKFGNPNKMKMDSYKHFSVFILLKLINGLFNNNIDTNRSALNRKVCQQEQNSWMI